MSFPQRPSDIKSGKTFAILTTRSVTIPGDERSRTNPGHGYPEHTDLSWSIETFPTQAAWEQEIKDRAGRAFASRDWVPVILNRPEIKQTVSIEVQTHD